MTLADAQVVMHGFFLAAWIVLTVSLVVYGWRFFWEEDE